jgi:antitoxin YefM
MYNKAVHNPKDTPMAIQTTYSRARANLAKLLDAIAEDREIVIIERRKRENVAMISAAELNSLLETAHLLRSPKNARRLLAALAGALDNKGKPMPLDRLRREVGLERKAA